MGLLEFHKHREELEAERRKVVCLETDLAALIGERDALRRVLGSVEVERQVLASALEVVLPGQDAHHVGEGICSQTLAAFDLSTFFLALLDRKKDQLSFPYYHEGGKERHHPPRSFSDRPGVSGFVLKEGRPLYIRDLDEAQGLGAVLTAAEKASGLIPNTWYGVPLGFGSLPAGLMAFMHFEVDAFPDSRRRVMDALGRLAGLVLAAADPAAFR